MSIHASWHCGVHIGVWTHSLNRCMSDQKKLHNGQACKQMPPPCCSESDLKRIDLSHLQAAPSSNFLILLKDLVNNMIQMRQCNSSQNRLKTMWRHLSAGLTTTTYVGTYTQYSTQYQVIFVFITILWWHALMEWHPVESQLCCPNSKCSPKLLTLNEFLSLESLFRFVSYFCH